MNVKHVQIMNIRVDRGVHFMNSFHVKRPETGLFVRGEPIHPDCGSVPESKAATCRNPNKNPTRNPAPLRNSLNSLSDIPPAYAEEITSFVYLTRVSPRMLRRFAKKKVSFCFPGGGSFPGFQERQPPQF
jgi:hypothetical protein